MDYTKFLGRTEHVILPYLGGAHVFGEGRRLRAAEPRPSVGFHRFEVRGRDARALEAVDPPDLLDLPKARGHFIPVPGGGWLAHSSGLDRLALVPEDEPSPLAIARARRWHSGDLLFDALDFDGDIEEEARLRLERGASLGALKGVPATLRTAFGVSLALNVGRRVGTPLAVREVTARAVAIADGGEPVALQLIEHVARERREHEERLERERLTQHHEARIRAILGSGPFIQRRRGAIEPTLENASERAEGALDGAEARMLASRRKEGGALEVSFEFMGERFVSVVDAITLQVHDAGVCLAGEDELVTLESLPGVIREAIQTGVLVITRH